MFVYNLEIKGQWNYYVAAVEGAGCVLVHNACKKAAVNGLTGAALRIASGSFRGIIPFYILKDIPKGWKKNACRWQWVEVGIQRN